MRSGRHSPTAAYAAPRWGSFRRLFDLGLAAVDAGLDLAPEVADQALHGPGGRVTQGADGVTVDPRRDVPEEIDLALLGLAALHALQHAPHPAGAFPAGRALAAALVLVEIG